MGATDWTRVSGSLTETDPGREVIVAATRGLAGDPSRGVLGMRSAGALGCYAQRATPSLAVGFDPIAPGKGGEITIAMCRGSEGVEPFAFVALQSDDVTAEGYKLGLSESGRVVLAKGSLIAGIPDNAPGASGVLRRSSFTVAIGAWVHLRLEVACSSLTGDAVLNVSRSTSQDLATPTWADIPGMARFIDDGLGVNSGSVGLAGGHLGMGARFALPGSWGAFDQIQAFRQS